MNQPSMPLSAIGQEQTFAADWLYGVSQRQRFTSIVVRRFLIKSFLRPELKQAAIEQ